MLLLPSKSTIKGTPEDGPLSRQEIIIIGAGMAGLIAGNILRRHHTQIVERQPELPNNHHAVLRFRTTRVSDACHIPFREVRVHKMIMGDYNPIQAAMLYSHKVTGRYELRSIIDTAPVDRYISPVDFITQASSSLNIACGVDAVDYFNPLTKRDALDAIPLISTMPMTALMDALEYPGERPDFKFEKGWTARATITDCDVHATAYCPEPSFPLYRASITGDQLIMEFVGDFDDSHADAGWQADRAQKRIEQCFGLDPAMLVSPVALKPARYAKLGRLSAKDRKLADEFMYWASTHFNVYSLGRFAKWQSDLMLDDVVSDVLKIERWITGGKYLLKRSFDK